MAAYQHIVVSNKHYLMQFKLRGLLLLPISSPKYMLDVVVTMCSICVFSVCRLMVVVELHNPAGTELQVEIDTQPSPNDR